MNSLHIKFGLLLEDQSKYQQMLKNTVINKADAYLSC